MNKQYGESGHFDETEGFTCDECDIPIGDHVKYDCVKRCVACWIEFEMNVLYGGEDESNVEK